MKADSIFLFIIIASFGALCQEIIQWYEIRNKLGDEDTKKMVKSIWYWLITLFTIIISGVGTMVLFYETNPPLDAKIPFVLGAAFPLIFKKLVAAWEKRDLGDTKLKDKPSFQQIAKKYFQ